MPILVAIIGTWMITGRRKVHPYSSITLPYPFQGRMIPMYFIGLVKFNEKQTKEVVARNMKRIEDEVREGIRVHGIYWTLGKYDAVAIFEAPDEKAAMKISIRRADGMRMETLVAVPIEEAKKLVE